jgi:hypothetical protein
MTLNLKTGLVPLALAVALAGCGGSSARSGATAGTDRITTAVATPVPGAAPKARKDPVTRSHGAVKAQPYKHEANEVKPTGAGAINPCKLVSRSQAVSILGGKMAAPQLAPLGPTCIYSSRAPRRYVTVAVTNMRLPQVSRRVVNVALRGGHRAVCVSAGTQRLLVALTTGRVLSVGGPCPIAAKFALEALPRLPG